MNEFATAYLNPFKFARTAFERVLINDKTPTMDIKPEDLQISIASELYSYPTAINGVTDWNNSTLNLIKDAGGIYASLNKADDYVNTLRQKLLARIEEGEKKLRSLEATIRSVRSVLPNSSTTAISISGGDTSWVDQSQKYYKDAPPLSFVAEEGCYRLPDTGFFSAIRANGGLGGRVRIEKSLTPLEQIGDIADITDGSRSSYWLATSYLPSLVKAATGDVPWLPTQYTHGSAAMLTYQMDRPTLVGEIFIDPLTTEPFDLLAFSWTPLTIQNSMGNPNFTTGSSWIYSYGAYRDSVNNIAILPTATGMLTQGFGLSSALATSLSGVVAPSGVVFGQRFEFVINAKTIGDNSTNVKVSWFDSLGTELRTATSSRIMPSFYDDMRIVDYAPSQAVSGKLDIYFNSLTSSSTGYVSSVSMFAGEEKWVCDQQIASTTTISLPATVTSSRFSVVLLQTSPRRETYVSRPPSNSGSTYIPTHIDSSLKATIDKTQAELTATGDGSTVFAYKFGIRELDLRYREYVPRATLTSIPLLTRKEIRNIWISVDQDTLYTTGVGFYVIPFDKDDTFKIPLKPYKVGTEDSSGRSVYSEGTILSIFTPEEEDAGWAVTSPLRIISEPTKIKEVFNGSDRDGKISLTKVPHIRRPSIRRINTWLNSYSILPNFYDPNLEITTGITNEVIRQSLRSGTAISLSQDDITTGKGYLPIRVTVATNGWTATQDIFGKPDTETLRSIDYEVLTPTTVTNTSVEVDSDYITFDQYLASNNLGDFLNRNPTTLGGLLIKGTNLGSSSLASKSLKEVIDILSSNNMGTLLGNLTSSNPLQTRSDSNITSVGGSLLGARLSSYNAFSNVVSNQQISTLFTQGFNGTDFLNNLVKQTQGEYERFKANRVLPRTRDITVTKTSTVNVDLAFKTSFSPIVKGENGSLFKLYWRDADGNLLLISPNNYSINSITGLVIINTSRPTNYNDVVASYKYINKTNENSQFADVLNLINTPTTSTDVVLASKTFPICRNMTDYVSGKAPQLKRPNFNTLDTDYYPIIEYYITPEGDLIFSRDFFTYGDIPATITVEYETLGVTPRLEVDVVRSSGANTTPRIFGINLRTKEGTASPLREGS